MADLIKLGSRFDKQELLTHILTKDDYHIKTNDTYRDFNIFDKIVCFFNGRDWNVVSLDNMLAYPILYFDFWNHKDDTIYENTLLVCPITMRSMIYKGKIQIIDIIDNNRLYLLNTDTNDEFFMDLPYTGHFDESGKEKNIKSHVKRHEVKILTLRDSFMYIIDPKYIIVHEKKNKLIYDQYYNNRFTYLGDPIHTTFHPKTVVYMIQYYSYSINAYRYTVIVGKDINKNNISGYDYKLSGLWTYINEHKHELSKKKAYIYPIFWFMIDKLYKDVKMILIT